MEIDDNPRYGEPYARPARCDVMTDEGVVILTDVTPKECDAWFVLNDPGYESHTHRRICESSEKADG